MTIRANRPIPETPLEKIIRRGCFLEDSGEPMAVRLARFIDTYPVSKKDALKAVRFVPFGNKLYSYDFRSSTYDDIKNSRLVAQ